MNTFEQSTGERMSGGTSGEMSDSAESRMTRSDDRRIAGVAAGIAESFDLDPTWIRLGFVIALLFTLGTALLAYVILWVVLPPAGGESVVKGGKPEQPVLLVVLGLAAVVLIAANVSEFGFGIGGGVLIPVLLIGAGVVMLQQRSVLSRASRKAANRTGSSEEPPAPEEEPPDEGASTVDGAAITSMSLAIRDDDVVESPDVGSSDPPPPGEPDTSMADDTPSGSNDGARSVKQPSVITPVVLSLGLIASGIGLALHLSDVADVKLTSLASVWLLLIAGGLIVSAFRGRARGLIPLGILASFGLLIASVADPIIDHGTGERDYLVVSLAELQPEYRLGVGDLLVDLGSIDLGGATRTIDIELSIGKLVVVLPPGPALDLTIDNDIGQIEFFDESEGVPGLGQDNSGVGNDFRLVDAVGDGELIVTIKNRIGYVEVTRARG